MIQMHETYVGIEPFKVLVDKSSQLEALVAQAREIRELSFEEKLVRVRELARGAMVNCYELWKDSPDEAVRAQNGELVTGNHPLSFALEQRAGCCRYQGALFFVLGYEAELGEAHWLQSASIVPSLVEFGGGQRSVFNDVQDERGELHHVSVFEETLVNKAHAYSRSNPQVFDCAIGFGKPADNQAPRRDPLPIRLFSYHHTHSGLVLVSDERKHIEKYAS